MKKFFASALLLSLLLSAAGCKGKGDGSSDFPQNFNQIGDAGRVKYMMNRVQGDSLARFILYGALGKTPGVKIDTLAIATNYAYEHLKGDDLEDFSREYDAIVESLPLPEKMKAYKLGGSEDPQGLGYTLGLEYVSKIRDNQMKVQAVEEELKEFRNACGSDTATYRRFMTGLKLALQLDHGKGIPEDVYRHFTGM